MARTPAFLGPSSGRSKGGRNVAPSRGTRLRPFFKDPFPPTLHSEPRLQMDLALHPRSGRARRGKCPVPSFGPAERGARRLEAGPPTDQVRTPSWPCLRPRLRSSRWQKGRSGGGFDGGPLSTLAPGQSQRTVAFGLLKASELYILPVTQKADALPFSRALDANAFGKICLWPESSALRTAVASLFRCHQTPRGDALREGNSKRPLETAPLLGPVFLGASKRRRGRRPRFIRPCSSGRCCSNAPFETWKTAPSRRPISPAQRAQPTAQ
ncbi:hypothetical protein M885DRAFT_28122 [Pelagophyceae sp. CCMP2097]|nr:hypothetical protein M885DRAFT_28122 [Pelagophyceae sp. CCMP2097]|mmetsp:Transcript_18328/g.65211  ORF Transcript_18328/g.65211 Transcript_18328/m.65211 type:complete len:268 (-) Transcript_18328:59-862(-)